MRKSHSADASIFNIANSACYNLHVRCGCLIVPPFHMATTDSANPFPTSQIGRIAVYRRKLNRAWETLRSLPMPAIASDRLVDLHNDLTYYDTVIATQMREFLRGNVINTYVVRIDHELEEGLRSFKAETPAEVECRRDLLRYKRRIDDVVRELLRVTEARANGKLPLRPSRMSATNE